MASAVRFSDNQGRSPVRMIVDDKFRAMVMRFKFESPTIVHNSIGRTIMQLQYAAIREARNQLKIAVYDAPLPASVGKSYAGRVYWTPDEYMRERRIGTVYRAIVRDNIVRVSDTVYGDVRVNKDAAGWEGFYHAWILNNGGYATRSGTYRARPYWTITFVRMEALLKETAVVETKNMIEGLLGRKYQLMSDIPAPPA